MANTHKTRRRKLALWIQGARLRTLPLAIAPVAVGAGAAMSLQHQDWTLIGLALAVALFLQIGVNYANDFSDGIRGTDNNRVGPLRLTGSGSIKPSQVRLAAFIFFSLAAASGAAIVLITQIWWLLAIGAAAILAGWFYTGGKRPYGYAALGEPIVFIFFGLVATIGTTFIQTQFFDEVSWFGAIAMGCFATAVLLINNLRDIDTDRHVGKKTLSVLIGARASRIIYIVLIWAPLGLLVPIYLLYPATFFAFSVFLFVAPLSLIAATAKSAKEFNLVLKLTSFASLSYGLLLGWGLATIAV